MVTNAPTIAAAVLLLPALSIPAPVSTAEPTVRAPGGIVAIVNQDVITRGELDRRVTIHMEELSKRGSVPLTDLERMRPRIERAMLDWLIEQALLLQEAKKNGITTSEAEIDVDIKRRIEKEFPQEGLQVQDAEELYKFLKETYNYSREEYRGQVRNEILINRLLWTKYFLPSFVTPGEVREYYHSHTEQFETDSEYSFYMITVDNSDNALLTLEALNGRLKKEPFVEVARAFAAEKGDKGDDVILWKKKTAELKEWKQPLPDVILRMKGGETQGPIRTANGFRYLHMVEVKAGNRKSFEEAEALIQKAIRQEYNEREKNRLVTRLKREAHLQDFLPPQSPEPARPTNSAGKPQEPSKLQDASPDTPKKNPPQK